MTKKSRTILFLSLAVLFLISAPAIVFYSQGYRLDFENKEIKRTGGIFLKAFPKQANVFISGTSKENTDFFWGSILVENLLPGKYQISVSKESFHPWQKNLEVEEGMVTEAKNIVLFPKNPLFQTLSGNVEDFWVSPSQDKIVLKENSENYWSLKLYETESRVKSHLLKESDISPEKSELLNLEFSEENPEIVLEIGLAEKAKKFLVRINKTPPEILENPTSSLSHESFIAKKESEKGDYVLKETGHLFFGEELLTQSPFPVKQETEYKLEAFGDFIFLKEADSLYMLKSGVFEIFKEGIKKLKASPNLEKVFCLTENEIWTVFLGEKQASPKREKGQETFLGRFSQKIKDCFWLNPDYLIFSLDEPFGKSESAEEIKIIETDDRDAVNIITLAKFEDPKIFWSAEEKILYVLSENNLYFSDSLAF